MNRTEFTKRLRKIYEDTVRGEPDETISTISMQALCNQFEAYPDWAIGPIEKEPALTFRKKAQWKDPTGIGWRAGFLFNPSVIEREEKLYLFYRAAPKKESLSSRIGLAVYEEGKGWMDYAENPILFPETEDEVVSTEDPKVYALEDGYILFYNGIGEFSEGMERVPMNDRGDLPGLTVTIKAAVSKDLFHWERIGQIVPDAVSKYWAKGAVVPRDPAGRPVKIGGKYRMFLSEGCGGKQTVGSSDDMLHWEFQAQDYLDIGDMGTICEVACALVNYCADEKALLLDFFYRKPDGTNSAAQALYSIEDPFHPLAVNKGGTLSWGGLVQYRGRWCYAQGWDAKSGDEEMYFYTAPIR